MNDNGIQIAGLRKTYSSGVTALKGIDLDIPPGMFGLLGPNGAGKTTLMKILATLLEPDAGTITVFEKGDNGVRLDLLADPAAARRRVGYLPQEFGFYPSFTAVEMLRYLATLKGVADRKGREALVTELLERVNLVSAKDQKLGGFSGGMRQRLGIAQALIGHPRLIIVDEPTAGLDPEERLCFHNLLAEIAVDDTTVLLSTHIVSDVANLCSRMAILYRGEILATDTPATAMEQITGRVWEAVVSMPAAQDYKSRLSVISAQMIAGQVRLRIFSENGRPDEGFSPAPPTLEDYYFSLVNRPKVITET